MAEQKRNGGGSVCGHKGRARRVESGWELHLLCAGLIEEEGEKEWSFRSHGLSFSVFCFFISLDLQNKSDFLPLKLLLQLSREGNGAVGFLPPSPSFVQFLHKNSNNKRLHSCYLV